MKSFQKFWFVYKNLAKIMENFEKYEVSKSITVGNVDDDQQ